MSGRPFKAWQSGALLELATRSPQGQASAQCHLHRGAFQRALHRTLPVTVVRFQILTHRGIPCPHELK